MKFKQILKSLSLMTVTATAGASASAADGVEVMQPGNNNTIVRITGDLPYLLIPVEEDQPESQMVVLSDGKVFETINVRLAANNIDYYVPYELTRVPGEETVLNIKLHADRGHARDIENYIVWSEMQLSDTFDTTNVEKYRPLYHHTPQWGWMNDPNGMFYKDGVWHLNFQHNPYGSKWQNLSWGHSTSSDLIHWEPQPETLRPDGLGMIFSGSAIVDKDNVAGFGKDAIIALYTSADASQIQSLAYSTDNGQTFTPYVANPVIVTDGEARDPNFFYHPQSGKWILLLAHALDHEMLIYSSDNLRDWTLESAFGRGYGSQAGVWECPDLMELTVNGTDEKRWVLICNINPGGPFGGSAAQYFTGTFDGHTFTPDNGPEVTKWMDYGKDHYATVSFSNAPDGRHTVLGWMSNWQYANEVPTMQYRSANTLPRDLSLNKDENGQYWLVSTPSPELDALRGRRVSEIKNATIGASPRTAALPRANDGIAEITVDYNMRDAKVLNIVLTNKEGDRVEMALNPSEATFALDRSRSGVTNFSRNFNAETVTPISGTVKTEGSLRIFIDRSSIEVFDGEGRFVMTNLVFPTEPYSSLSVSFEGGKGRINSLGVYEIKL